MANRRMFSLDVIDTDNFLDMPASARLLYYDLGMRADDDGFLQSAQKILRFTGASVDDIDLLVERGFVIRFETGIIVIRHWRVNNQIRTDRYKPTVCADEKSRLVVDGGGVYRLAQPDADGRLPTGCQTVANMETQCRVGEDSLVEQREVEEREESASAPAAPPPPSPDNSDLSVDRERCDTVERLIKRHGLAANDTTLSALLEDAERHSLPAVEDALSRAAMADTRGGLSVNFYRLFLPGGPFGDGSRHSQQPVVGMNAAPSTNVGGGRGYNSPQTTNPFLLLLEREEARAHDQDS